MDWEAFALSLRLAAWTTLVLAGMGLATARLLAWRRFPGRSVVEALVALPLVLPPTVLGFYLLALFSPEAVLGRLFLRLTGDTLAFSFAGLLLASVVYSLPFAVQPMLRAFEAVPAEMREAAWLSGLGRWATFLRVELPLAWPGVLSGLVLAFAHTMGEFGVVLMVGGNIAGETRTVSIAIYDRVQAFDDAAAARMSALLLLFAVLTIGAVFALERRRRDHA
ncbi:molybdate ABC transporter permease subunit [Inmirania thermothiophila]|uniref:Molybdenum transport system permease n=1 Tax=Inmirania thermothiophila TaxID=1750597 RepID=A0A3N1Y336_9GAMM|nr:molybdate ABC transporter permease subunit [Inmirania thermothiophila]ROR31982.1 molybdate transport system permease protein [Inmirania thermothiophila]